MRQAGSRVSWQRMLCGHEACRVQGSAEALRQAMLYLEDAGDMTELLDAGVDDLDEPKQATLLLATSHLTHACIFRGYRRSHRSMPF